MGPVSFQILSNLHLETHPSYKDFSFPQAAHYLALLGDIGHVADNQLFAFLEEQNRNYSAVFFLLGNHEPYHMSWKTAKAKVRAFEAKINRKQHSSISGRFVFLDQTRYDVSDTLTVLGRTPFSSVPLGREHAVEIRLVDFKDILQWTIDDHNDPHESDLAWLNAQVPQITKEEPNR